MHKKIWDTKQADQIFSIYIRNRDKWKCTLCKKDFSNKKQQLHNSHFWGRNKSNTRYDPKNCIAACYFCHYFKLEGTKKFEYKNLMIELLGDKEYKNLEKKSNKLKRRNRAIKEFMDWIIPYILKNEKVFEKTIKRLGLKNSIKNYK